MNISHIQSGQHETSGGRWSDHELELFHDAELDEAAATRLSQDLRTDAGLRARLSELTSIDRLARRSLLSAPPPAPSRTSPRESKGWRLEVAIASGVLALAAALAMMLWPAAGPLAQPAPRAEPGIDQAIGTIASKGPDDAAIEMRAATDLERAGVRVLASFTGPAKNSGAPKPERIKRPRIVMPAITAGTTPAEPSLQDLLDAGEVDAFLSRTRQASGKERDAAFGLLGGTLRSAMTAQRVLDGLSPEEQLSICVVWAHEPHLRPVTFERLALLQERPELRERVGRLVGELSRSRELLAWVKSYRLESPAVTSGPKAG